MVKASATIAVVMAKIIFPFIVLNFSYFTNVGIKFDISVGRLKFFLFVGHFNESCGLRVVFSPTHTKNRNRKKVGRKLKKVGRKPQKVGRKPLSLLNSTGQGQSLEGEEKS